MGSIAIILLIPIYGVILMQTKVNLALLQIVKIVLQSKKDGT